MTLKVSVSSTDYNSLSDDLKKEYQLQADGSYKLDLGGLFVDTEDPQRLKSSLEAEREEHRKTKAVMDRLEQEKLDAERSKITDIDQLRESFKKELEDRDKRIDQEKKEAEKKLQEQQLSIAQGHRDQEALRIATELFGQQAPLLLPHIQKRLEAVPGDNPGVKIVDPLTGQALIDQNLENFKKSISTDPLFKPMVVVSRASGGGANDGSSSVLGTKSDGQPKTYNDYTPAELLAIKRENPEQFKSLAQSRGF